MVNKGIAWVTTSWINKIEEPMRFLQPLADKGGLEIRMDSHGKNYEEKELLAGISGVVAAIPSNDAYTARVFEAADALRIIARTGVGYNSIDLEAATAKGVIVTTSVGKNADSVAEHTLSLMLASARRTVWIDKGFRAGGWADLRRPLSPMKGKILGILGMGHIGKAVARRAAAFGMKILAHDPMRDEVFASEVGVFFHPLEEVVGQADFLSCHLPLLPETKGLLGEKLISRMKPGSFLINTSRGEVVDINALTDSLREGKIGGAALDVFPREPPERTHPIFSLDNVILTPHVAGLGRDACEASLRHAVRCALDLLEGKRPPDVVNSQVYDKKD